MCLIFFVGFFYCLYFFCSRFCFFFLSRFCCLSFQLFSSFDFIDCEFLVLEPLDDQIECLVGENIRFQENETVFCFDLLNTQYFWFFRILLETVTIPKSWRAQRASSAAYKICFSVKVSFSQFDVITLTSLSMISNQNESPRNTVKMELQSDATIT